MTEDLKHFLFNPLSSFKTDFAEIKITNFYTDVKWYFPKMKNGQLLSIPITEGKNPLCAFFVKDISRQMELIDNGFKVIEVKWELKQEKFGEQQNSSMQTVY